MSCNIILINQSIPCHIPHESYTVPSFLFYFDQVTYSSVMPHSEHRLCTWHIDASFIFTPTIFKKVKLEIIKSMDWEMIDLKYEDTVVKVNDKVKILNCTCVESLLNTISCPCRKYDWKAVNVSTCLQYCFI